MGEDSEIKKLLSKLESPLPVCRICLNDTLEYIDLETSLCILGDSEVTYMDGYKELHSSIIIDQNLPSRLCVNCADDLCKAYLFSKRVQNAESTLKRLQSYIDSRNGIVESAEENVKSVNEDVLDLKMSVDAIIVESIKVEPTTIADSSPVIDDNDNVSNREEGNDDKSIDPDTCFECKDCGKICASPESYRKHCLPHQLATCKTKARKSIKCKQCGKIFKFYGTLEKHLLIHAMAKIQQSTRGKTIYECNSCRKTYQTVVGFIEHMHIHNGTKPYKCSICGVFHHTRAKLKCHRYHSHGKGLELRLAVKNEKMKFMETEPLRFKTKCRYCDKLVVNEVIKRHENPEKRFSCIVCSKKFYTEQNLKYHSETHLKIRKPFKCNICGQEIMRKYSLKLHMQRHESDDRKFKCEICETVLSTKSSLSEHRLKHFSASQYKCGHCDKGFIRKSRLVYHMRTHTGENPFKCDHCDKSYKMSARLKTHIRVAHSNHTYDCDKCDAKFKSYNGFVNHQFVHTGFPFKCPQCSRGAPNRERLKKHLQHVHKGYMTSERFDELYPNKSEARKIQLVKPKEDVEEQYETITD